MADISTVTARMSESDRPLWREAKELVSQLEAQHNGDPYKIRHALSEHTSRFHHPDRSPTPADLKGLRINELAGVYFEVSNGRGGILENPHSTSRGHLENVLAGREPSGQGLSLANREALRVEGAPTRGSLRKAGGPVVSLIMTFGTAAANAAESGQMPTLKNLGNDALDAVLPGWKESQKGNTCKAFGQAAGTVTAGGVIAITAVPAVGAAALTGPLAPVVATAAVGTAAVVTYGTVAPAAEFACNRVGEALNNVRNTFSAGPGM